jgi:D-arginine dehydrogenase
MDSYDVIVIGGGMAGISIGYELARERRVALLEMESTLAYHTTGRSAAMFLECYGGPVIRALTTASRGFLTDPSVEVDGELLTPRPMLHTAATGRADRIRSLHEEVVALVPDADLVGPDEVVALQPLLRPGYVELALLEPGGMEIDVHALNQGFRHGFRQRGGQVLVSSAVRTIDRVGDGWVLTVADGTSCQAPVVVNAAGAWADQVGQEFGAASIGLRPLRRTAFTVDAPIGSEALTAPMVADIDETFYFKQHGGQLLCSPADETLQEPGDARPDELEIARALDALNEATTLAVRHVRSSWAGLRSFVADRAPVVGFDPVVPGLFWCAGQGGYGIQTAPALARTGAALLLGEPVPADIAALGVTASAVGPARLAPAAPSALPPPPE